MASCDDATDAARVGVFIRPMSGVDYADTQQRTVALFDVVLTAGAAASKTAALYVARSVRDFAQLQRELERELAVDVTSFSDNSSSPALASPLTITPATAAYLATQGDDESTAAATAAEIFCVCTEVEFEERFAWQLEHFLTALANHADGRVRNARALQRFLRGGSIGIEALDELEVINRWFADSEQNEQDTAVHERISSGSVMNHTIRVQVAGGANGESDGAQALVLWRFASQGEHIMFSARFAQRDQAKDMDDGDRDPYAVDPYSLSAMEEEDKEADDAVMAHYHTYYSFPEATGEDSSSSPVYEYGYFLATTSGDLVLEWENADSTSVLSKPLTFQVRVLPLSADVSERAPEEMKMLAHQLSESQRRPSSLEHDDVDLWLQKLILKSKITMSLRRILGFVYDYDCKKNVEFTAGLSVDAAQDTGGDDRGRETEALKRVQEEKLFHEQRAREFEERTTQLEDALRATKGDLNKALDSIKISEEIYKASLEAITQLEVAASASRLPASVKPTSPLEIPSLLASPASALEDVDDIAIKTNVGVSGKEHQRVVNLCTTFQEQCLWRSIELAESEKRNMVLEAKLQESVDKNEKVQAQTTSLEDLVASLQAEVKKLKTHKSILVQEVKKLQPYSQINLAALVQEAQEARMMQRSLQAQLDSHNAAESVATSTNLVIAAEEDGAGGGFVVVESDDHSS